MAPIVAPRVVQYTLSGTYGGTTWANVLHYRLTANTGIDRAQAIDEHAIEIADGWQIAIAPFVSASATLREISWVDLDNADGTTGSRSFAIPGNDTNPCLPANATVLIRKVAAGGGRRSRNGRWYLTGCNEDVVNEASIAQSFIASFNTALDQFLDITGESRGTDFPNYSADMTVMHTVNNGTPTNPDRVYAGDDFVTSLTVDSRIATQRRRARR